MNSSIPEDTLVLVTGGTGFTGAVLVRKLLEAKLRVRVIARPSERATLLKESGCEVILGQVYDPEVVKQATNNIEYIFHLAAAFREPGIGDEVYEWVHVESTKLLAQAVAGNDNFKRFIHISTIGVHGHIEEAPADEEYRYSPGDQYQNTKLEGELWIRNYSQTHALPLSVIRPAAIYGPGDRRLLKLFKMARWPVCPLLGFGKCLYHLTHVEDLCDAFILAAHHPNALGQVFICGDEHPIAMKDIIRLIAKELGTRPIFIRIPVTPFFVIADICEILCKKMGIDPPIYRRRVAFFTKDRAFNTSKIRNMLGYRTMYDNTTGILSTLKWYRQEGWMK